MKKAIAYTLGGIVVLYLVLRTLGVVQVYHVPTPASSPAVEPGDYVLATNLVEPKLYDFVAYNVDFESGEKAVYLSRLCGREGDMIEMKSGVLYLNGDNFDKELDLKHYHAIPEAKAKELQQLGEICDGDGTGLRVYEGVAEVHLRDRKAAELGYERESIPYSTDMHPSLGNAESTDDFGPIAVPKGHIFFLGDNRHNSMDSRMMGFVLKEDVVGVALNR